MTAASNQHARQFDKGIIEDAIQRLAPEMPPHDVARQAEAFVTYFQLQSAARLATAWRGTKGGARALASISGKIVDLAESLCEMPTDAQIAFRRATGDENAALMMLHGLNEQVHRAHQTLLTDNQNSSANRRNGDVVVRAITEFAAKFYRSITGLEPTRIIDPATGAPTGPFDAFLTSIFAGLGIEAVADSAIRAMARRHKRREQS